MEDETPPGLDFDIWFIAGDDPDAFSAECAASVVPVVSVSFDPVLGDSIPPFNRVCNSPEDVGLFPLDWCSGDATRLPWIG